MEEMQNALNDLANAIHYYVTLIYNLKLKQRELEKYIKTLSKALAKGGKAYKGE